MKSIIDIGMDVHKKTYSLCAVLKESGEVLSETKIPADPDLIIKFIENAQSIINQPDADIKAGYEAGCLAILYTGSLQKEELIVIFLRLLLCSAQLRIRF